MNFDNAVFRWLHLSDLHLISGGVKEYISRDTLKRKIEDALYDLGIDKNYVNCLILSGDIFHQSKLSTDSEDELTALIKIYQALATES